MSEVKELEFISLYHDQPMYFLVGAPATKVQLSFKAKIFAKQNFYLGYTQRIFWELFEKSSPFRDVNYNPLLFYRFPLKGDPDHFFDLIGYEHESNGKGGRDSRSWNRIGVHYQSAHEYPSGHRFIWGAKAWVPYYIDSTNADIAEYKGVYELFFTLSHFLGSYFELSDLTLRIYSGGRYYVDPLKGGQELTLRLNGKSDLFLANVVFQIFHGCGESMLEYRKNIWGLRAGLGI